jgi:hypothetical protein
MTAQPVRPPALPDYLPNVDVPTRTSTRIHCHTCDHPVTADRAPVCAGKGHTVSVVQMAVTTFNAAHARPFTATPAPYLGSSR